MNALKLISPVGLAVGTATGLPGQLPEGHEGAFGDTLSTVLAGNVTAPIAQQAQPGIRDLATLSLTPAHDLPAELDAGQIAASSQMGSQQLAHPLIGTITNAGNDPATPIVPLLESAANAQNADLPISADVAADQSLTSPRGPFSADHEANHQPIVRSSDAGAAAPGKTITANGAPALATIGANVGDAIASEQASAPSRQALLAPHDNRLNANSLNSSTGSPIQVEPSGLQLSKEASKAGLHLGNYAQALDPRSPRSNQQTAPVQQAFASERKAHSLANNLSQKGRQPDTALVTKAPSTAIATPVQNVGVVEAWNSDFASSTETLEFLGSDSGRLDFNNTLNSKPQTQSPQSPHMQIAIQVTRALPQGVDRFTIQLHPMELGTVDVQLNFAEDGHVSALIVAERPETLDMLQRDSRALERSLANAGLQLENGSLSFSLKQDQNQRDQGFSQSDFGQSQTAIGDTAQGSGGSEHPLERDIHVSRQRLLDIRT